MTTKQICQLGFKCPYHRYSEDGDEICIYPYIRITEREENETFGFPEDSDCPLMDYDSPFENWRLSYGDEVKTEKSEKVNESQIDFLKSCPCCGSTKLHVVAPNDGCYCWDCGLTMPNRPNWRERWNRRVRDDQS